MLTENYASSATSAAFTRATTGTFPLSSYLSSQVIASSLTSLQLHTNLSRGAYNELIVSNRGVWSHFASDVQEPIVLVTVPGVSGATETLKAGTAESAQGVLSNGWNVDATDNLTLPLGTAHELTLGVTAELFRLVRGGVAGSYGTWTFSSLDSLQSGIPQRFETQKDYGSASVPMAGGQYAAYAGDIWRASERLSVTLGLRADVLLIRGHAPYNREVDSLFARRTDDMPGPIVQFSPRLGFNWDLFGTARDQLRGGAGIFTGRFPLAWAHSALYSYGVGTGKLQCGTLFGDLGPPPRFVTDYRAAPTSCANGQGLASAPRGDVDLLDHRLRLGQTARASLAYDRRLPWNVQATVEALVTRGISDFTFVNLNLKGPQGVDTHGRVMYGTIAPTGVPTPATVSVFSEVIDLVNNSAGHSSQLSARLEKRFSNNFAGTLSYTYSQVRDVELPLRSGVPSIQIWAAGRPVSGRHDDLSTGTSLYDLPHRVVLAGTYTAPWRAWSTDFSFYFVGESGTPVTYVAWGAGKKGDLNADGSNTNDPIYIPKSAADNGEILFSGLLDGAADNSPAAVALRVSQQQAALENLIEGTDCLRRQRGRIMERNSCREPWSNTTIASVRQSIPIGRGRTLTAQLDVFNVLNLIRSDWGHYHTANPALLEQVGETTGASAQPVFRYDLTRPPWLNAATESAYQLQLSLRYSF